MKINRWKEIDENKKEIEQLNKKSKETDDKLQNEKQRYDKFNEEIQKFKEENSNLLNKKDYDIAQLNQTIESLKASISGGGNHSMQQYINEINNLNLIINNQNMEK